MYTIYFLIFPSIINVKTAKIRGQLVGRLRWVACAGSLALGVRSISTSETSQRLHAGDLIFAYLVGLYEGDGYFTITKKGIYLTYELGIELSIRDVQLIYKIKKFIKCRYCKF